MGLSSAGGTSSVAPAAALSPSHLLPNATGESQRKSLLVSTTCRSRSWDAQTNPSGHVGIRDFAADKRRVATDFYFRFWPIDHVCIRPLFFKIFASQKNFDRANRKRWQIGFFLFRWEKLLCWDEDQERKNWEFLSCVLCEQRWTVHLNFPDMKRKFSLPCFTKKFFLESWQAVAALRHACDHLWGKWLSSIWNEQNTHSTGQEFLAAEGKERCGPEVWQNLAKNYNSCCSGLVVFVACINDLHTITRISIAAIKGLRW